MLRLMRVSRAFGCISIRPVRSIWTSRYIAPSGEQKSDSPHWRAMAMRAYEVVHSEACASKEVLEVSVDLIDPGLYLGNVACTQKLNTLKELNITHILTIDLVPVQDMLLRLAKVVYKYIKLADVPNEDLLSILPDAIAFIKSAVQGGGTVLVHCYFGVSRSAAVTIAYMMDCYKLQYEDAYTRVKSKRRFIGPNPGFVSQLKLFAIMDCKLDRDNRTYKQFRLRMAGQKLKQVKILPQLFADLIKPDPALARERPDPIVYRCKKCRRVVASQANIIPHVPKYVKVQLVKNGMNPPPSTIAGGLQTNENGQILMEKLKILAGSVLDGTHEQMVVQEGPSHLDGYHEDNLVDPAISARTGADTCRLMWFVEPMAWMAGVGSTPHGKLHCPKCRNKIGSFSWVSGCHCPCGQKVAPAFYLVPSKVEYSNIVMNIQYTV